MAIGMALLPAVRTPEPMMAALAVSGAGMTLALTSLSAQLMERVPHALRGRVMALWSMAFLGSRPAAAAANAAIADRVSVQVAVGLVAINLLAAAAACRPARLAKGWRGSAGRTLQLAAVARSRSFGRIIRSYRSMNRA